LLGVSSGSPTTKLPIRIVVMRTGTILAGVFSVFATSTIAIPFHAYEVREYAERAVLARGHNLVVRDVSPASDARERLIPTTTTTAFLVKRSSATHPPPPTRPPPPPPPTRDSPLPPSPAAAATAPPPPPLAAETIPHNRPPSDLDALGAYMNSLPPTTHNEYQLHRPSTDNWNTSKGRPMIGVNRQARPRPPPAPAPSPEVSPRPRR
ncbi:hypothetical protein EIP91_007962, partial [Steccherinum ochraceum]